MFVRGREAEALKLLRYGKLMWHGKRTAAGLLAVLFCMFLPLRAAAVPAVPVQETERETGAAAQPQAGTQGDRETLSAYREYQERLASAVHRDDIAAAGFTVVEEQIFPIVMKGYGEVSLIPAYDDAYDRLILFFADETGTIVYKTEELETNYRNRGQMRQPNRGIAAIVFEDLNRDGLMDIVLVTTCVNVSGDYAGKPYRVGDVLFQSRETGGFYRDYRIADKINRFGMNKNTELITAFVRDGHSTEFLYTAATLDELLTNGLNIIEEQYYTRIFGKLGRLRVVPGVYHVASFDIFMVYLVNEQGDIISSLQPMGTYDNLYALKGIRCQDIDGDGLKDIVVLAKYSYEDDAGRIIVESDYSIYYQRTGGFSADVNMKSRYRCGDDDTMEILVEKARAYWGWRSEQ